ncbi:KSR1, partial [Cordylochernes scorpioides]
MTLKSVGKKFMLVILFGAITFIELKGCFPNSKKIGRDPIKKPLGPNFGHRGTACTTLIRASSPKHTKLIKLFSKQLVAKKKYGTLKQELKKYPKMAQWLKVVGLRGTPIK